MTHVRELVERLNELARMWRASNDAIEAYNANFHASKAVGHISLSEEGHRLWRVAEDAKRDHQNALYEFGPFASEAASALSVGWRSIPEGWRLVPIEPTPEMLGAWYRYKNGHRWPGEEPARDTSDTGAYAAMLAAAPIPAQQEQG